MSFKFILGTDTSIAALDATTVTGLDMGAVFTESSKIASFRLGNTGTSEKQYQFLPSGVNSTITDDVEFSTDKETWDTTLTVAGVQPNQCTDTIFVRLTPDEGSATDLGSFLIHVDEFDND